MTTPGPEIATAVGKAGVIVATTDGGATWSKQSSGTSNDLHGVTCGGICIAVGANGTIVAAA